MPSAIILLNTAAGMEKALLASLRKHECVQEAYAVESAYDILVKVTAETYDKLTAIIAKIRTILPQPHSIMTLLVVDGTITH